MNPNCKMCLADHEARLAGVKRELNKFMGLATAQKFKIASLTAKLNALAKVVTGLR